MREILGSAYGVPFFVDEVGHTVNMVGIVLGKEDSLMMMLYPHERGGKTIEQWQKWLKQSDDPVFQVTDMDKKIVKAIVRKATRQVEESIKWEVYRRDKFTCQYCGESQQPLTVDHYLAQDFGGKTTVENLKASCRRCNKLKANKTIEQWSTYRLVNGLRGPNE